MYVWELTRICSNDVYIREFWDDMVSTRITMEEAVELYGEWRIETLEPIDSEAIYLVVSN